MRVHFQTDYSVAMPRRDGRYFFNFWWKEMEKTRLVVTLLSRSFFASIHSRFILALSAALNKYINLIMYEENVRTHANAAHSLLRFPKILSFHDLYPQLMRQTNDSFGFAKFLAVSHPYPPFATLG